MKTTIWCKIILLTFIVFSYNISFAQETSGGLQGKVTNFKGEPLAGATVKLLHSASGTPYHFVSFDDGSYRFTGLRIGLYTIEVSYTGLQTERLDDYLISLGEPPLLNFTLRASDSQLGAVVVTASRRKSRADGSGQLISVSDIRQMPTISRSLQDLTRLVPQASKDNSFGGANFRYNNVTIDGAINNDAIGFSPSLGGQTGTSGQPGSSTRTNPISLDAIEDMQVYLAPYDVKIGNFTGGSVNAVTRSGSNTLKGSVYAFGRNASITGSDHAGKSGKLPNDFYEYQAGGRLGFPIIKNRLFFFTNVEFTRRQDPVLLAAGSEEAADILSHADAQLISNTVKTRYGFDVGSAGNMVNWSRSQKFFNRLDFNINSNNQLAIRNNTIFSKASTIERDQQNFRFGSIAFEQVNNQSSSVAELKSKISRRVSNSAIIGFTSIHDYRTPTSDPAFPQVQIVGRTPGTTIFFGTDREASIFNMKQQTIEITDNVNVNFGKHNLTIGTHNELYKINYGFVNAWNGRVDYNSITDFVNNQPARARGSFHYENNNREYLMNQPAAKFNINFYSLYVQDELRVNNKLRLTPGLRADYTHLPNKPLLSSKTRNTNTDINYGNTFEYTPLNRIDNSFLSRPQVSPRLGFRYDWLPNEQLVLRGGAGLFTGRIPLAWIGYAYYNNGDTYGAYDQRADNGSSQFQPGSDPLAYDRNLGIAAFAIQNGQAVNNKNAGKTQVDVIDNDFVMPQVFRTSLSIDYKDNKGVKYKLEGIFTKVIKDVLFSHINMRDQPSYYAYDTAINSRQQPIYPSGANNPLFANAYLMSNTTKGYRYSITGQVNKRFNNGPDLMAAYTFGMAKDITNGIRNSMESNWQLNQSLNPNNPTLAYSNFDIRHRIVSRIGWSVGTFKNATTSLSLFVQAQSGSPFTYGFLNFTPQGTAQQVALAYIPAEAEAINFFSSYTDEQGRTITAAEQAKAFNDFISNDKYLSTRRGQFTERNMGRTPWNVQADFRLIHAINLKMKKAVHNLEFTWDIMNVTNLLNNKWGWVYFSPNTYNSTASVGLRPYLPSRVSGGYPLYQFQDPGKPYAIDYFASRWQMQMVLRYSF